MKTYIQVFTILVLLFLGACANTSDPVAIKNATTEGFDIHTKLTTLDSDPIKSGFPNTLTYRLSAIFDKKFQFFQIRMNYASMTGWAFYDSAVDMEGHDFAVTQDAQTVMYGGNTVEAFSLVLSREYLDTHKATGIDIRLGGVSGDAVKFTGAYITGFLAKYDEVVSRLATGITPRSSVDAVTAPDTLGIRILVMPPKVEQALHLGEHEGVLVAAVTDGSPAMRAGLRMGDVLLKWNDVAINGKDEMDIAAAKPTPKGTLYIQRGFDRLELPYSFQP